MDFNVKVLYWPSELDWLMVRRCALVTAGKDTAAVPDIKWRREMLECRHSPIRELQFRFLLEGIPYWVAMHLVRHHVGFQPYVRSQRTDRTGISRDELPQNEPVDMIISCNAEALLTLANKRLCRQTAPETRKVVEDICSKVIHYCPEFEGFLVPQCGRDGGVCHERRCCGHNVNYAPKPLCSLDEVTV